ncbi:glycerophosphodiester phosphodiesterase family protein [Cryobacterium sp. PH29-G1]|uniref:glycerophosphodiester phosphodiesterase family protein n=1 Tax=Cryobacterium sp. PH29-G1 TaxID=3046211 RepID=UPI0024BBAC18|nr:glycerophosphodiester phosphodiesterase family protein [Cryobacterium sp. PH29-G1]MDJ0351033.1 glycerophosphodiester phosphodiesterase family protein [Cryobacterium sp. PH29-G1]
MHKILITAAAAALTSVLVGGALLAVQGESALARPAMSAETATSLDSNGGFDLQSHRGGRGEHSEESLAAFTASLELGVSTLELDTHLTRDDRIVVWHDDVLTESKCRDTDAAFRDDPDYPYAGHRVRELTLAQIQMLDCGYQQLPGYPEQQNVPENVIAELADVFALLELHRADTVQLNIETKIEVPGPTGADEMAALTRAVVASIAASGRADRVTVQSFDWASLNLVRQIAPELRLVALTQGDDWLEVGQPGASVHLGGIDIDDYDGSVARAAAAAGYDALSPIFETVTPKLVADAHAAGLPVIPWTVSETALMHTLIDMGVDGIITDYPTRLRAVLAERGASLPISYPAA